MNVGDISSDGRAKKSQDYDGRIAILFNNSIAYQFTIIRLIIWCIGRMDIHENHSIYSLASSFNSSRILRILLPAFHLPKYSNPLKRKMNKQASRISIEAVPMKTLLSKGFSEVYADSFAGLSDVASKVVVK